MDLAIALYASADGQPRSDATPFAPSVYHRYHLMPLAEGKAERDELDAMARVGEWDDAKTRVVNWWVPGWLPLLTDGNSNYLCIDTVGAFGGTPGQMIEFIHDDAARAILAPSFDAWFDAWVEALEAAMFELHEHTYEGVVFASLRSKPSLKKFFATRLPGFPQRHKSTKQKIVAAKSAKPRKAKAPQNAQLLAVFKERMSVADVAAALAAGADVNVRDAAGNTPLHLAMELGNEAVPDALIAAGADVHARNDHGDAPIHLAVLKKPRAAPLLIAALARGGADLNAPSGSGKAPIFNALYVEAAHALVAHGVSRDSFVGAPRSAWLDAAVARSMLGED